jgi:predicted DsbA family dithiol-disulfide isomerase
VGRKIGWGQDRQNSWLNDHSQASWSSGQNHSVEDFAMKLTIEVFSDVVCPWCYIGKRRLEKSLELLGGEHEIEVLWRPFQLNPGMPPEGIERQTYRTAKFGSWERSLELDARVAAVGASVGIAFAFDRIARTPDTFDAHRLIWYSQGRGKQNALVETMFRAYFTEGQDIGERKVLCDLGVDVGLDRIEVECFLSSDGGLSEVRPEEERGRRMGIDGVPYFLIDGRVALSGAQEPEVIVEAIEKAARGGDA